MASVRYRRGVEKLRILAENCELTKRMALDEPFLREAYAFGDVLDGTDPLDSVDVALVLDLPPEEVPWESHPDGTAWLVDLLRLDKGGYAYRWRSYLDPVWNHYIRRPVRFWSLAGPDEEVLQALAERRFEELPHVTPDPSDEPSRLMEELGTALQNLRAVQESYWDHEWRRAHRGGGRYPEHYLWEAVTGYLDLRAAAVERPPAPQ
jgi:hypothetical protein